MRLPISLREDLESIKVLEAPTVLSVRAGTAEKGNRQLKNRVRGRSECSLAAKSFTRQITILKADGQSME